MNFILKIGLKTYLTIIGILGYLWFMLPYFIRYNISPQWDFDSLSVFIIILTIVLIFIFVTFLLFYIANCIKIEILFLWEYIGFKEKSNFTEKELIIIKNIAKIRKFILMFFGLINSILLIIFYIISPTNKIINYIILLVFIIAFISFVKKKSFFIEFMHFINSISIILIFYVIFKNHLSYGLTIFIMAIWGGACLTLYFNSETCILHQKTIYLKKNGISVHKKNSKKLFEKIMKIIASTILISLIIFFYADILFSQSKIIHSIENTIFKILRVSNYRSQYIISSQYAKLLDVNNTKILHTKDTKINVLVLWNGTDKLFIKDDKNSTIGIPQNQILQSIAKMTTSKNEKKDSNANKKNE